VQTFSVTSGPVVADYVTAGREEELLRVLEYPVTVQSSGRALP
jgi:hypothetical protein